MNIIWNDEEVRIVEKNSGDNRPKMDWEKNILELLKRAGRAVTDPEYYEA